MDGTAIVRVAFDEEGKVTCVQILSDNPMISNSVVESARAWKFAPYKSGGKLAAAVGNVTIAYRLRDTGITSEVR
jgi:TonB family protein